VARHACRLIKAGAVVLAFDAVAHAAPAISVDQSVPSRCTISGYLAAANGATVHSGPRPDAPAVGRLPPPAPIEPGGDVLFGTEFDILGVKNGWLLISKAEVEFNEQSKVVFKGPGWIPGEKVGFVIGSQELRAAPANNAKIIAKLTGETKNGEGYGPDSYDTLHVHACQGHFVELTIEPPRGVAGGPRRGWVNKVCSNQKTTCDPSVDDPDAGK